MFCTNCSNEVREGAQFCNSCGSRIESNAAKVGEADIAEASEAQDVAQTQPVAEPVPAEQPANEVATPKPAAQPANEAVAQPPTNKGRKKIPTGALAVIAILLAGGLALAAYLLYITVIAGSATQHVSINGIELDIPADWETPTMLEDEEQSSLKDMYYSGDWRICRDSESQSTILICTNISILDGAYEVTDEHTLCAAIGYPTYWTQENKDDSSEVYRGCWYDYYNVNNAARSMSSVAMFSGNSSAVVITICPTESAEAKKKLAGVLDSAHFTDPSRPTIPQLVASTGIGTDNPVYGEGNYLVGTTIPEGYYRLDHKEDYANYFIADNNDAEKTSTTVERDEITSLTYVYVTKGQTLWVAGATATPVTAEETM